MFQQGIQWVADERRRQRTLPLPPPIDGKVHYQAAWAQGYTQGDAFTIIDPDQSYEVWVTTVCPTACCVAGNFCAINGDTFLASGVVYEKGMWAGNVEWVLDEDGEVHRVGIRGRDLVVVLAVRLALVVVPASRDLVPVVVTSTRCWW